VCQIVVGELAAFTDATNINITLPILSRGLGGATFTLPNFDAEHTGDFAEGDEILIKLYRTGAAPKDVFGGDITKLTPRSPESPHYYLDVEAIDKGQALQVPDSLFSAWYSGTLGKTILIDAIEDAGLVEDVDPDDDITSTHNKGFDEVLHWNAVKEMCDAVVMGDGAIGADGYVDSDGTVSIFKRGIHASAVSLTDKIKSYGVDNDYYRIRNKVKVYSQPPKVDPTNQPTIIPGHAYPSDYDTWTKVADDANWIEGSGVIDWPTADPSPLGGDYLRFTAASPGPCTFRRTHDQINCLSKGGLKSLNFWLKSYPYTTYAIRLLAPDTTHYFETPPNFPTAGRQATTSWVLNSLWFGPDYEYNANTNPAGTWAPVNSPSWLNIRGLLFSMVWSAGWTFSVDGLYYGNAPYQAEVSADPGTYGVRCLEPQWVDGLRSDYECQLYGQGLLKYYQNKVKTVNVSTFGDNDFLPGYMQPMVVANDGLSESFRILEIVHHVEDVDWTTSLVMGDEPIKLDWWVRKMWEKHRQAAHNIGKF